MTLGSAACPVCCNSCNWRARRASVELSWIYPMEPMDQHVSLDEVDLEGLVACCLDYLLLLTAAGVFALEGALPPALPPGLPPPGGVAPPDGAPPPDPLNPAAPPPECGWRPELE